MEDYLLFLEDLFVMLSELARMIGIVLRIFLIMKTLFVILFFELYSFLVEGQLVRRQMSPTSLLVVTWGSQNKVYFQKFPRWGIEDRHKLSMRPTKKKHEKNKTTQKKVRLGANRH